MKYSIGLIALLAALLLNGCSEVIAPAPVGPRAIASDLSPWVANAPTVTFTGWLQNFHVATSTGPGEYVTWSVHRSIREAAEVDIRACEVSAAQLRDQRVTITGRLIERQGYHFPLLVAEQINLAAEPEPPLQVVASGL